MKWFIHKNHYHLDDTNEENTKIAFCAIKCNKIS